MVRHRHSDAFLSQGRKSLRVGDEDFCVTDGAGATILAARTSIMAAKYAYATNRPQWLSLFARVIELVEACPVECQAPLMQELHRFVEPEQVHVAGM